MVWCFTTYRLVLSSWIYTAILSQCMMLSHWRKSQMPTWTNIYGMKQTRDVCFLHGSNQLTLNLLHSLRTNGAKVCTLTLSSLKKCLLLVIAIWRRGRKRVLNSWKGIDIYTLAWEQAFVITAAGCTFLRPLEDLRRVRERLAGGNFSIAVRCFCVSFLSRQCKITPEQNLINDGPEKVKK